MQNKVPKCFVKDQWNTKVTPRYLIQNGTVYMTGLTPGGTATGHPDVVGFMQELYELSKLYKWVALC